MYSNVYYYVSKLVSALWLVNLVGRTLLHRAQKFNKLLGNLFPNFFSAYEVNNSFKLSFTLNCVLKRANDLKPISNWLAFLSTWSGNLKPFLMNQNNSRIRQTHNRDLIYILISSSRLCYKLRILFFLPLTRMKKNTRSVTYGTDLKVPMKWKFFRHNFKI